ncbi:MAG: glycosyltransferase family 2 protein [Bacilli bacterium]|nr:glycosyltransferase family 2 protein [Bacilli bacterium]
MKLLSVVVPSYNAEKFLRKNLDSLVKGGDEVEILVVNDGSKDGTLAIAREYEEKYPGIVIVIDQPNKGHGGGLNSGIAAATGLYFKCVDADDWVDEENYPVVMNKIREMHEAGTDPDLYLYDFIFDRVEEGTQHVESYKHTYPHNKLFSWDEVPHMKLHEYLMMHSMIYKTSVLRESGIVLPEHTFYVDNIYVYQPLPFVKSFYYTPNVPFYHYLVGRADQSVNFKSMDKNFDHQMRVFRRMTELYTMDQIQALGKHHARYVLHDLSSKTLLSIFFALIGNKKEKWEVCKQILMDWKARDPKLYKFIRHRTWVQVPMNIIRPLRSPIIVFFYKIYAKITGWH